MDNPPKDDEERVDNLEGPDTNPGHVENIVGEVQPAGSGCNSEEIVAVQLEPEETKEPEDSALTDVNDNDIFQLGKSPAAWIYPSQSAERRYSHPDLVHAPVSSNIYVRHSPRRPPKYRCPICDIVRKGPKHMARKHVGEHFEIIGRAPTEEEMIFFQTERFKVPYYSL